MISILNILFNHPISEATPNSKITGAYYLSGVSISLVGWGISWVGWGIAKWG